MNEYSTKSRAAMMLAAAAYADGCASCKYSPRRNVKNGRMEYVCTACGEGTGEYHDRRRRKKK